MHDEWKPKKARPAFDLGDVVTYHKKPYLVLDFATGKFGGKKVQLKELERNNSGNLQLKRGTESIWRHVTSTNHIVDYQKRLRMEAGDICGGSTKYKVLATRFGPRGGKQHLIEMLPGQPVYQGRGYDMDKPRWVRMTGQGMDHIEYGD